MSRKTDKTSRQTQRDSARTARLEAVRKQQRDSARRRKAVIVAASVAVVGLIGGVSWAVVGTTDSGSPTQSKAALTGLQTYSKLARDHVTGKVPYPQTPPVGGNHSATWQNCGVYSAPVPIVASAWGVQLKLTAASDPRLKSFINTYKSGSKAPEPGGECTGGTGTPKG